MKLEGFVYVVMVVVGYSCIDVSWKMVVQRFILMELVGIVGFFDVVFFLSVVFGIGMFDLNIIFQLVDVNMFLEVLVGSVSIKVVVGYMYQWVLQMFFFLVIVFYLVFIFVFLVFISYVVM